MSLPSVLKRERDASCDHPEVDGRGRSESLQVLLRDFTRARNDFRASDVARAQGDLAGALEHVEDALEKLTRHASPIRITMSLDVRSHAAFLAAEGHDSAACSRHSSLYVTAVQAYPRGAVARLLNSSRTDGRIAGDMRFYSRLATTLSERRSAHDFALGLMDEDSHDHGDEAHAAAHIDTNLAMAIAILERQEACGPRHAAQAASRLVSRGWADGVSDVEMGVRLERALRLSDSIPWPEMSITLLAQAVVLTIRRGNRAQAIEGVGVLSGLASQGLDGVPSRERSRIMLRRQTLAGQYVRAACRAAKVPLTTYVGVSTQVLGRHLHTRGEVESHFDLDLLRDPTGGAG